MKAQLIKLTKSRQSTLLSEKFVITRSDGREINKFIVSILKGG